MFSKNIIFNALSSDRFYGILMYLGKVSEILKDTPVTENHVSSVL